MLSGPSSRDGISRRRAERLRDILKDAFKTYSDLEIALRPVLDDLKGITSETADLEVVADDVVDWLSEDLPNFRPLLRAIRRARPAHLDLRRFADEILRQYVDQKDINDLAGLLDDLSIDPEWLSQVARAALPEWLELEDLLRKSTQDLLESMAELPGPKNRPHPMVAFVLRVIRDREWESDLLRAKSTALGAWCVSICERKGWQLMQARDDIRVGEFATPGRYALVLRVRPLGYAEPGGAAEKQYHVWVYLVDDTGKQAKALSQPPPIRKLDELARHVTDYVHGTLVNLAAPHVEFVLPPELISEPVDELEIVVDRKANLVQPIGTLYTVAVRPENDRDVMSQSAWAIRSKRLVEDDFAAYHTIREPPEIRAQAIFDSVFVRHSYVCLVLTTEPKASAVTAIYEVCRCAGIPSALWARRETPTWASQLVECALTPSTLPALVLSLRKAAHGPDKAIRCPITLLWDDGRRPPPTAPPLGLPLPASTDQ